MQPADIAKIRTPGSVSLSPDGTRVAFAVSSIAGSAYRSELFVAPTDGPRRPNASPTARTTACRAGRPTAAQSRSCGSMRKAGGNCS